MFTRYPDRARRSLLSDPGPSLWLRHKHRKLDHLAPFLFPSLRPCHLDRQGRWEEGPRLLHS